MDMLWAAQPDGHRLFDENRVANPGFYPTILHVEVKLSVDGEHNLSGRPLSMLLSIVTDINSHIQSFRIENAKYFLGSVVGKVALSSGPKANRTG